MSSLDRTAILAEADSILRKPDFSHQDKARVDSLIALADSVGGHSLALKRAKTTQEEMAAGLRTAATVGASVFEAEFRDWLRHGKKELLSENSRLAMERAAVASRGDTRRSSVRSGNRFRWWVSGAEIFL